MRCLPCFVVIACLSILGSAQPAEKIDASQVLAAAREALGGDARLAGVKNFVASGRTR